MYELIQLSERTYYIKSPTNIGLVRLDEQNVCLIEMIRMQGGKHVRY